MAGKFVDPKIYMFELLNVKDLHTLSKNYGIALWYGMAWHGMAWYGIVWHSGMVWYGTMGARRGGGGGRRGTCPPPPGNSKIWGPPKDNLNFFFI